MKNSIGKIALASCIALALFSSCKTDAPIKFLCNSESNIDSIINLRVYPNPASDIIAKDFYLPEKTKIKSGLYDMLGKERAIIINSEIEKGANKNLYLVDTTITNGIYILAFEICNKRIAKRIIIAQ
jgi:hypothetical protein